MSKKTASTTLRAGDLILSPDGDGTAILNLRGNVICLSAADLLSLGAAAMSAALSDPGVARHMFAGAARLPEQVHHTIATGEPLRLPADPPQPPEGVSLPCGLHVTPDLPDETLYTHVEDGGVYRITHHEDIKQPGGEWLPGVGYRCQISGRRYCRVQRGENGFCSRFRPLNVLPGA